MTNKTKIITIKLFIYNETKFFVKYSYHQVKSKTKNPYQSMYTECVP